MTNKSAPARSRFISPRCSSRLIGQTRTHPSACLRSLRACCSGTLLAPCSASCSSLFKGECSTLSDSLASARSGRCGRASSAEASLRVARSSLGGACGRARPSARPQKITLNSHLSRKIVLWDFDCIGGTRLDRALDILQLPKEYRTSPLDQHQYPPIQ